MRDGFFYTSIAGFVVGVFLRSFADVGAGLPWLFCLLGAALFVYYLFVSGSHVKPDPSYDGKERERKASLLFLSVFLCAFGLGVLRYDFAERTAVRIRFDVRLNTAVTLEGHIVDEPDVRETTTQLILKTENIKVLLIVPHEPQFLYGDKVTVSGRLERPKNFADEKTLREVDYVSHLEKDSIFFQMFRPRITLLAHGEGNVIVEKLFAFKNAFIQNINSLIPQPHASLLGGLVVGAKQSLGKELLEDFRTVGVIHIVVLSGYNITIIAYFIEWLFSRLRKNLRLVLAALSMILFALMVGAGATVVRATIMALLVVLARSTGRIYAVTRALLVAGVIMLLHNPKILVFDTSFQLSFLATVGLIYVSPFVEPRVKWITEKWHMREIFVATIATQLFVLPFLMYKTGLFSVVSLPVNLLILSAIPLTMLFGFLAGMAAFLSTLLALPFAYLANALLTYELGVVEWFARLPFAEIGVPYFPLWLVVLWYGIYAVLYIVWRDKQSTVALQGTPATIRL